MANTTLTQSGQQVQADLDLLDNNNATQGQVLKADGNGGAAWGDVLTPSSVNDGTIAKAIGFDSSNNLVKGPVGGGGGGGFTLIVATANARYWVFFANNSYQEYMAGTTGTYSNAIAIGLDGDAMILSNDGYHMYFSGTSTDVSGGVLPLAAFRNAGYHMIPTGVVTIRLLLSDYTCSIV